MAKEIFVPAKTGFVEADNFKIYWEYFGAGEKEVIVLLNGLAMSVESWYSLLAQIHPEYDVLLYDYAGQGKSSCDDVPYYINRIADYLALIMDKNKIEKVHTMGVSYGGFIAADFGRLHQDRLYTQTLSGILLTREVTFQMYQDLSLMFYRSGDFSFEIYTHYLYEKIFHENFLRAVKTKLEGMRKNFYDRYKNRVHSLIRLTLAQDPFFDYIDKNPDAYKNVKIPTLIISGREDRAIPLWMQQKMCNIYPDNKLVVLPESGHLTYLERPDLFWTNFKAFVRAKSTKFSL